MIGLKKKFKNTWNGAIMKITIYIKIEIQQSGFFDENL